MEEAGDDAGEGEEGEEEEEPRGTKRKAEPEPQEPVTLGYKTFVSGGDACAYFKVEWHWGVFVSGDAGHDV